MAVTTLPNASVQARDDSVLNASIAASDTTITVAPLYKWVAGVKTQGGFDSTAGFCMITDGTGAFEYFSFDVNSVNATTKVSTLTGVRRGLSPVTAAYGSGTGIAWDAGSRVFVVDYPLMWQNMCNLDSAQTITGVKTVSTTGAIRGTSTTVPLIRTNPVTTTQRNAMSPSNGDSVYDSDLGQFYDYAGGAWVARATGTNPNAANNTAGKVDIATAAEVAAGTATDGTSGALNVIPVSIVKPTSTGAVSGTVPCLNTSSMLDGTLGGIGAATPALGTVLIGAGAGLAMTTIGPGSSGQVPTSNGTTLAMAGVPAYCKTVFIATSSSASLANPTSLTVFATNQYTIPANDLINGVAYEYEAAGIVLGVGGSSNIKIEPFLGSTSMCTGTRTPSTNDVWHIRGIISGTAAAGASVSVRCTQFMANATTMNMNYQATNVATNGTLLFAIYAMFGTSDGSNSINLTSLVLKKLSTTPAS